MSKKCEYGIFPPCIDAYRKSFGEYSMTFKEFCDAMKGHALSFGEQSIGATLLQTGQIPYFNEDRVIVCLGWFGEKGSYVVTAPLKTEAGTYWFEYFEVVQHNWPSEWDVT